MRVFYMGIMFIMLSSYGVKSQDIKTLYVSPFGSDSWSGSLKNPFSSLQRALDAIRELKKIENLKQINIRLRAGIYRQKRTIIFDVTTSGSSSLKIDIAPYHGEKVTVSGSGVLNQVWSRVSRVRNGVIWKTNLSSFNKVKDFKALYVAGKRLNTSMSPVFYTKSGLPGYRGSYGVYDFKALQHLMRDSIQAFCGFVYNDDDLDNASDISSAELIFYHSWDASWHTISNLDIAKKQILLSNPMTYPVGFFNPRLRYKLINSRKYFTEVNSWYLDKSLKELFYMAKGSEDPNKLHFSTPHLEQLVRFDGNRGEVSNISFSNIIFEGTNSIWGIHEVTPETASPSKISLKNLVFQEGFSSIQASMSCGEAIEIVKSHHIKLQNCSFINIDGYGMRIGEGSNFNEVIGCTFKSLGGGGVIIGFDNYTRSLTERDSTSGRLVPSAFQKISSKDLANLSPSNNRVYKCEFSNLGIVHPAAVGIGIMQGNHNTLEYNVAHSLPYTGISVGWWFGDLEIFNSYNQIKYNYIYDVMKVLADGGGIYTIGNQTGTIYKGNYIDNVTRSYDAVGASNNGFFFDQGSKNFLVDSNVVQNVKFDDIRFNGTQRTNMKIEHNSFQKNELNINIIQQVKKKIAYSN